MDEPIVTGREYTEKHNTGYRRLISRIRTPAACAGTIALLVSIFLNIPKLGSESSNYEHYEHELVPQERQERMWEGFKEGPIGSGFIRDAFIRDIRKYEGVMGKQVIYET